MKTKNSKIANNISPPIATLFYTSPQILNMKKTTLVIVAAALISSNVNSQITKHNWLLGGNAGYTHTNNNSSLTTLYKNSTISLSPNIGYFVWDKFCAGIKLSILLYKNDFPANSGTGLISYSNKTQFYNLGPFARYYFLKTDKKINVFMEGLFQHQLRKDISPGTNSKQAANIFTLNAGPVIYLNSSVGIELTIGYSSLKYPGISGSINTIQTNIGLQIHIQKDN